MPRQNRVTPFGNVLEFRGRHRAIMAPGRYTELFFLDEATELVVMMPLDKAMFGESFTPEELNQLADAGVRTFFSAYGSVP